MLAAMCDEEDRAERRRKRSVEREHRAQMQVLDEQIQRLCALSEALLCAELTAAGYQRHNRGEWRRKRGNEQAQGHNDGASAAG
jgi:hypothetical protein